MNNEKKNITIQIPSYEINLFKKVCPTQTLPDGLQSLSFSFRHDGDLDTVKGLDGLGNPLEIDLNGKANESISFISLEVKKRFRFGVWERW
jgi:hypothetical protein